VRDTFALWGRLTGRAVPRWYLPRGLMRPQVALLEPLQRMLGLPAFLSRESVDISRGHLDFSSGRANVDLGWQHPDQVAMWTRIVDGERRAMARRRGWRDKLRHQPVVGLQDHAWC
jgi:hypothetical protein